MHIRQKTKNPQTYLFKGFKLCAGDSITIHQITIAIQNQQTIAISFILKALQMIL